MRMWYMFLYLCCLHVLTSCVLCMHLTEPQSDASDVEGRIRALTEELKRRKLEADRLKKEARKKNKEKLYAQEDSLKKQIEVSVGDYRNFTVSSIPGI